MNKLLLLLFMWSNLFGVKTHTIYIAGPPIGTSAIDTSVIEEGLSTGWYKESRLLYSGIKREVSALGNSIELFPKKSYRKSITKRRKLKHTYSKSELVRAYRDIDSLFNDLVELILKRRSEILERNLNSDTNIWSNQIHIRAHGLGSRLLQMLDSEATFSDMLGTKLTFDGISCITDIASPVDNTPLRPGSQASVDNTSVDKNILDLYIRKAKRHGITEENLLMLVDKFSRSNSIININIQDFQISVEQTSLEEISDSKCNSKQVIGSIGTIIGIVCAILALL